MAVAAGLLDLYLMTPDGLIRGRVDPNLRRAEVAHHALWGEHIRGVSFDAVNPRRVYVASISDVYRSEDGGDTWEWLPAGGLDYREIWCMAAHPTRGDEVYVGTLPAAVFVSHNGGGSFEELASFRRLPDYARWTFPPQPHTAHIRSFALDRSHPDDLLVGIEEGGVAISHDAGATWRDVSGPPGEASFPGSNDPLGRYEMGRLEHGRVYRDVHNVVRDPANPDRLYATTGMGTFRSDDLGGSWTRLDYGMERAYAVPLAIHPARPDRVFIGAAENGPPAWKGYRAPRPGPYAVSRYNSHGGDEKGALPIILRSEDRGDTWRRLENGLPQAYPYMACMLKMHPDDPDAAFVCYTDGRVFSTTDAGDTWHELLALPTTAFGIAVAPR